jgi:2-phospho-L-lactate transferase/gluconeogenesis factor (CofD/UPF0052 family)
MSASDHVKAVYAHGGHGLFQYALINCEPVSVAMKKKYAEESAEPVECDLAAVEALGPQCLAGNFLDESEVVRHATDRICRELIRLAEDRMAQNGMAEDRPGHKAAILQPDFRSSRK